MNVQRKQLTPGTVGYQKTVRVSIEQDGSKLNLTGKSLTAKAKDPQGNYIAITPTAATQSGSTLGELSCLITAAQMTTGDEGTWELDVYIGDSPGAEEPITKRYQFKAQPKETEA